jgi:hypothetical protein
MIETQIALSNNSRNQHTTVEDYLVSARTLIDLGCHELALEKYRFLLKKKVLTPEVMSGVAHCLVHIVRPKHIAAVVDHFARDIFTHPRNRKALKFSIVKRISSEEYPRHFSALSKHLVRINWESNDQGA